MMRPKERIKPFMEKLADIWASNNLLVDWRFGQILVNFFNEYGDPFYWEEDTFLKKFEEYVKQNVDNSEKL